jgi:hypothetical protein
MKTWLKSVVPLFALAIAPLAHAEGAGDQTMRDRVKDQVVGALDGAPSGPEAPEARELRETVDRLARRISDLETKQEARNATLGNADDHGGWW